MVSSASARFQQHDRTPPRLGVTPDQRPTDRTSTSKSTGPKSTGMARKVDELGRMVLPSELRRRFRIHEGDYLGIHVEDQRIILTKVESACVFCEANDDLATYKGKLVCPSCLEELRSL